MSEAILEVEELKVGSKYQQKKSKRFCHIVKISEIRIQYLYEDTGEKGPRTTQYRSAYLHNFRRNFRVPQ